MLTFSLQSGSNGNAIYVEAGGKRMLFDAGISGKCAKDRMAAHGKSLFDVDAIFLSHNHSDHTQAAGTLSRRYDIQLYMTRATCQAISRQIGSIRHFKFFRPGQTVILNEDLRVYTIPTPHDATDGVAFVVESEGKRLGILTDLGHPFEKLQKVVGTLDAVYLESNYDPDMLASGPYPPWLKRRIAGPAGHISNLEAATLLRDHADGRLQWAALSHLSDKNNEPEVALDTHRQTLGNLFPLHIAPREETSPIFNVA